MAQVQIKINGYSENMVVHFDGITVQPDENGYLLIDCDESVHQLSFILSSKRSCFLPSFSIDKYIKLKSVRFSKKVENFFNFIFSIKLKNNFHEFKAYLSFQIPSCHPSACMNYSIETESYMNYCEASCSKKVLKITKTKNVKVISSKQSTFLKSSQKIVFSLFHLIFITLVFTLFSLLPLYALIDSINHPEELTGRQILKNKYSIIPLSIIILILAVLYINSLIKFIKELRANKVLEK